jgi:hypothetical protein
LVIDGNYVQTGGTAKIRYAAGAGSNANVKGSFTLSGGSFMINDANGSANQSQLTVDGACNLNGGTFSFLNTSGTSGVAFMILKGTTTIGSGVTFSGFLLTTSGFYFNRATAGTIDLNIAHPFSSGSIRNCFYYNTTNVTGINETYNGTSAQTTVNGTNATPGTGYAAWPTSGNVINNLTINNSAGVTMSVSKEVNGALTLTSGKLAIGANNTLLIDGTISGVTATNSITGSSTSNLTIGGTGALGSLFFDQTTPGTTNLLNNFTVLSVKIPIAFFLFLLNEPKITLKIYSSFSDSDKYSLVILFEINSVLILNLSLSKKSGTTKSKFNKSCFTSLI